jgi:hypothetical protein
MKILLEIIDSVKLEVCSTLDKVLLGLVVEELQLVDVLNLPISSFALAQGCNVARPFRSHFQLSPNHVADAVFE